MIEKTGEILASTIFARDYNIYMLRPTSIITVLGIACLFSLAVHAQMRGGGGGHGFGGGIRSGGGFRSSGGVPASGGFRGAPAGPRVFAPAGRPFAPRTFAPVGPRAFAGPRTGVRTFSPSGHVFTTFPGRPAGFVRFHNGGPFFHNRFFVHGCFGCFSPFFFGGGFFVGSPFLTAPFWGPSFWGPPYYPGYPDYYGPPPPQPVAATSDNSTEIALATQVQRLTDEVDELQARESRARAENAPPPNPNTSLSAKEPALPAMFIFKDGRRISAQNYAIAGQTLWVLDEHAARKFPLDQLDADATQRANAANGVDIHLPVMPARQ
jgi:hypothetical protein